MVNRNLRAVFFLIDSWEHNEHFLHEQFLILRPIEFNYETYL